MLTTFVSRLPRIGGLGFVWLCYFFLLAPNLIVIPMSFSGKDELSFPPLTFSTGLFERFLNDPSWVRALLQSLKVAAGTMALSAVLGTLAAYAFVRGRFPAKALIGGLLISPTIIPGVVLALGTYFYFSRFGLVNTDIGMILAHTAVAMPFTFVTVSAGLRQVDPNLELAGSIMGASRLTIFGRIVLPQVSRSVTTGALFAFLISFDEVALSLFISAFDTTTLPVLMYSTMKYQSTSLIAVASTIITFVSILICLLAMAIAPSEKT